MATRSIFLKSRPPPQVKFEHFELHKIYIHKGSELTNHCHLEAGSPKVEAVEIRHWTAAENAKGALPKAATPKPL